MPLRLEYGDARDAGDVVHRLPIELIDADPAFNIRQDFEPRGEKFEALVESIQERPGLESPIAVRRAGKRFVVVFGHRRLAAYRKLFAEAKSDVDRDFFGSIPAFVRDYDELSAIFSNAAENIAREDLQPFEIAQRAALVRDRYGLPVKEIARRMGVTASYLGQLIALETKLAPQILKIFHSHHAGRDSLPLAELLELARAGKHSDQIDRYRALVEQKRAMQDLVARSGIVKFGTIEVPEEDIARPSVRCKKVAYSKVQEALIGIRALESFRLPSGEEDEGPPTARERKLARAILRWVLGLDAKSPFVISTKTRGSGQNAA